MLISRARLGFPKEAGHDIARTQGAPNRNMKAIRFGLPYLGKGGKVEKGGKGKGRRVGIRGVTREAR